MNWRSMDDLPAILPWRQREFRWRLRALLGFGPVLVVARRLNVGVGTVKSPVKSILEKLKADSRAGAVVTAQRRGLLP